MVKQATISSHTEYANEPAGKIFAETRHKTIAAIAALVVTRSV